MRHAGFSVKTKSGLSFSTAQECDKLRNSVQGLLKYKLRNVINSGINQRSAIF
jgi:hypothetical protein